MMTVHVLHAGDGYTYLTRQVASADVVRERGESLSDYYLQQGNPPGEWVGHGLAGLGVAGVVDERQMKNLFGDARHPDAERIERDALLRGATVEEAAKAAQLGRKFARYEEPNDHGYGQVLSGLFADFKADHDRDPLPGPERDELRWAAARQVAQTLGEGPVTDAQVAQVLASVGREQRHAVAGYDLVFTPAKSVSTLWALADADVQAQVAEAHRAAWQEALGWVEREAGLTRLGAGGVKQVDTHGLIAAAFDHLDSRAGDPNLHTHVAVSNRVQAKSKDPEVDGRWLSLDGRVLHALGVAASERYNANIERELRARLGVQFAPEPRTDGRMPVREIVGIDKGVREEFSSRRADIERSYAGLVAAYRTQHGRDPDRATQHRLAQQATLETRGPKEDLRPLSERVVQWRERAAHVLGDEPAVAAMVANSLGQERAGEAPAVRAGDVVEQVLDGLIQRRATWNQWHVRAEVQRVMRDLPVPIAQAGEWEQEISDAVLATSTRLTPGEVNPTPEGLSRADGASVYSVHGATLYSHPRVMDAERRLVEAATQEAGPRVDTAVLESALDRLDADTHRRGKQPLTAAQRELARRFASGGRRIEVGIGPAGAGKTTAMRALVAAAQAGGLRVVALAPSAAAAAVLREELGVQAETLAKFLHEHGAGTPGGFAVDAGTLVLVDEAAMAGTLDLDRAVAIATDAGAGVRLLGDPAQLNAVGAGGAVRLIEQVVGSAQLREVHRFATTGEAQASLQLRTGDVTALDFYLEQKRVTGGAVDGLLEEAYAAWKIDTDAGRASLMLAARAEDVRSLNEQAQLHRITSGKVRGSESAALRDGLACRRGDTVLTRNNDRRLRVGKTDYVKNGDLWAVERILPDGSLRVRHQHTRARTLLPAEYVAAHTELGYASTIHRAQGLTVDTCHAILNRGSTRDLLYTALTRGRLSNRAYVETRELVEPDPHEQTDPARAARDALAQMVRTEGDEGAALGTLVREHENAASLANLVPAYEDAIAASLEPGRDARLQAVVRHALPEPVAAAAIGDDAWPALAGRLASHESNGADLVTLLRAVVDDRSLDGVDSVAQVLHHRLGPVPARSDTLDLPAWVTAPPVHVDDAPPVAEKDRAPRAEPSPATSTAIEVNAAAWAWWQQQADGGREDWSAGYLAGRGLGAAEHGLAPAGWTGLVEHLRGAGYSEEDLVQAGVASRTRDGRLIDRFRDRVVFPIRDADGHVVAVTARANPDTIDDRTPKYLNHPTHAAYDKSSTLYGLDPAARAAIANGAKVALLEGAADVEAVRASSADVVPLAPCGTAVTAAQLEQLRELRPDAVASMIVGFDSDSAGQRAAARLWDMLPTEEAAQARAAAFGRKDPGDLVAEGRHGDVLDALSRARPLTDAAIDVGLSRFDLDTAEGRVEGMRTVLGAIDRLPEQQQTAAASYLASRPGMDPLAVAQGVLDRREQTPLAPPAPMVDEEVRAWTLRQADLIDARLDQLTDEVERGEQPWARDLTPAPTGEQARQHWRAQVRQIVAYRDRYGITTTDEPLGSGTATDPRGVEQQARQAAAAALTTLQPAPEPADAPAAEQRARDAQLGKVRRLSDRTRALREGAGTERAEPGSAAERLRRLQQRLDEQRRTTAAPEPPTPGPDGPDRRGPHL